MNNQNDQAEDGQHLAKHLDDEAIDLISKMLELNPAHRISAAEALEHQYFCQDPLPCDPSEIPKIEGELKELNFRDERNAKINANK